MKKLLSISMIGIAVFALSGLTPNLGALPSPLAVQTAQQDTMKRDTNRLRIEDRMRRGQFEDRRPTGDPQQLRSDSLRRGGATKIDTIRH